MPTAARALLLDLDGTIADTVPHMCRSFRYALEPFVQRLPTDAEIIATFGPPERVNLQMLLANPAIGKPGASKHLDTAEERFHERYESGHGEVKVYEGIPEVIVQAKGRGWRVGVFTGKSRRSATFALKDLGLFDVMECLVAGDDVVQPKPDPEGVMAASWQLGLKPEQMLLVGDSPGDIMAGKAAGARTAAALWGAYQPAATINAGPEWTLRSVAELRQLIEFLAGPRPT
jgi:HAD superfamily hydrolase (TIGR01549 family)